MATIMTPEFWLALSQIILINIVLSGDNAVVIALASRSLPPSQQKKAILFGSVGAIVLRVVLTFFAIYLLSLPYLKLVGAALLLWIGIGLLSGDDEGGDLEGHSNLFAAIKTIIVADLVMSLDNVIGVAAAAKGDIVLLCSDGLTGPLPEPDIARILAETPTLEAATAALVDGANARGGPDNVTVLLARIEDGPEAAQIEGERQAMENASVLAPLGSVDRRLLRHYFDRVTAKDGEELDLSAGLHLLMEGEVASEAQSAASTGVIGIRDFAGAPSPPAKAVGDVRALVLSAEAYDALERRRPLVAARLLRGLLETLAKQ